MPLKNFITDRTMSSLQNSSIKRTKGTSIATYKMSDKCPLHILLKIASAFFTMPLLLSKAAKKNLFYIN